MPNILSVYSNRIIMILLVVLVASCKKLVDVNVPVNSISTENIYKNDATAIAAVTNMYVEMSKTDLPGGGITSMSLFPGLSADELSLYDGSKGNGGLYYYQNSLTGNNISNPDFWSSFYKRISAANTAIHALQAATGLTLQVKQQLTGEARFVRALCYFYLVNLYGDVPLSLSDDYKTNSSLARTSKEEVYKQIIADLKEAQNLLNVNFPDAGLLNVSTDRVRPTKWAAASLLARTHLYREEWADAEAQAGSVIANSSLFDTVPLANAFLKNNREAIWQLQPVNTGWNTEDARIFLIPSSGPDQTGHPFYLTSQLLGSFEAGDQRKAFWVGKVTQNSKDYYYPAKYKSADYNAPVTEYQTVLRLSEQYLIRAEAKARQNKINEALSDLNVIRRKARLAPAAITDKASLLNAIIHERQVELFSEWGHRWLDLKRTGKVDEVMTAVTPIKGGSWNTNWQWYPVANKELLLNPNLKQTNGY